MIMGLIHALTVVAFLAVCIGAAPIRSIVETDADNRLVAVCVVFLVGWPLVWTFFLGPLIWASANDAGTIYPIIWYSPAGLCSVYIFMRALFSAECAVDPAGALLVLVFPAALIFIVFSGMNIADVVKWGLTLMLFIFVVLKRSRITLDVVAWGCRASLLVITGAVLASVLVNSERVVDICRTDKCGFSTYALTSPFAGNGNVLGLALGLILPFALAGRNLAQTVSLIVGVLALAEVAGSRTAEIGIVVTIVLVLALRLRPAQRWSTLSVGFGAALILSLIPVVLVFRNDQFTYRGYLWSQAHDMINGAVVFGSGPTAWLVFGKSAIYDANYSPHNGWLDIALALGLVGVVLIVASAALKIYLSTSEQRETLMLYFSALLAMSALESVYAPFYLGIVPFASILPMIVGPGRRLLVQRSLPSRRGRHSRPLREAHK